MGLVNNKTVLGHILISVNGKSVSRLCRSIYPSSLVRGIVLHIGFVSTVAGISTAFVNVCVQQSSVTV